MILISIFTNSEYQQLQIRGALKTFGLVLGKAAAGTFEARVHQLIAGNPLLVEVIEALLKVWRTTGEQLVTLHRRVLRHVQTDEDLPPPDDRARDWRRDGRCFPGDSG